MTTRLALILAVIILAILAIALGFQNYPSKPTETAVTRSIYHASTDEPATIMPEQTLHQMMTPDQETRSTPEPGRASTMRTLEPSESGNERIYYISETPYTYSELLTLEWELQTAQYRPTEAP